jgi:hypothetical protein
MNHEYLIKGITLNGSGQIVWMRERSWVQMIACFQRNEKPAG